MVNRTVLTARGAADTAQLARALPGHAVREFTDLRDVPPEAAKTAEVIVLRSGLRLGRSELGALPSLRHVIRAGSGLDGIDTGLLAERGISVHRNPGASAPAVGEWCLTALLSLARRIPLGARGIDRGEHLKAACMSSVPVSTMNVAVWGAGPVGRACADALAPHVAHTVFAARPSIGQDLAQMPAEDLPGWADAHVVAVPHTIANTALVSTDFLRDSAARKPLLIVVGRLATVDITACLRALDTGLLSGLAVDPVEASDIHHFPSGPKPVNLLVTPHIGAQRGDVRERLDAWVTETARALLTGKGPG
ncbi:NAD(P)-dependent oxidoreductase [Streptomyces hesseae]|uniref:NAD(P)-dependent oxidoreductase n=1 Tax=Streptomyces hesseae TaxID=3075519 RepID=A0ABU2SY67_9ACTN|nr:NAD(P)-dependent oxidoreductase [Streptomyces sp. DSM 40473]MDT0453760.1 NAD(P)-dependent oxidoreductase [Streptomyces sp. DSM 40473]